LHPDLKVVIELQQTDQRISDLSAQIDALPSQIEALQAQLNDFIQAHEDRKRRLGANQKERRELEADIQEIRGKISKHKDQLYQVKTNEQYRAMLKEIEGEEGNIRKIEDRILEKMMEAEGLDKQIREAAARLEGEKARVAAEKARLESLRGADVAERERMAARRKELAAVLSETVLEQYERLRQWRGVAVAEVRDGCCTACNVRLRPQAYNDLRSGDALVTCENCSRVLFWVEQPIAASGDKGTRAVV
jgi:predicted  nucleic acid-binding Zn-ribbon protein